jgi:excisionase family DNA binding protein
MGNPWEINSPFTHGWSYQRMTSGKSNDRPYVRIATSTGDLAELRIEGDEDATFAILINSDGSLVRHKGGDPVTLQVAQHRDYAVIKGSDRVELESYQEVADRLKVSKSSVKRAVADGELQVVRVGNKHPKINKQSVDSWMVGKRSR